MVQVQLGSESSALNAYYYYDDSDGQKWLANMSFSIAGLDYAKIMASGPLHFGVLWNIKSEIASGLGVPFENVSIFLSDAGNLNIAAVVVGPWMTKLDPTPADIDVHLLDRIKAIPDIDSAKTDGFTADLRLSVSTRRHDDGLWTTTTTTTSDGRRRRSPATHSPTAAPAMCTAPYTGQNVIPGGQNTASNTALAFSCREDVAGKNTKYPLSGKVECYTSGATGKWRAYSSGSTNDITNWGCGAQYDCWELPTFKFLAPGTATGEVKPLYNNAFKYDTVSKGSVAVPFPSVAANGKWCTNTFECCTGNTATPAVVLKKQKGTTTTVGADYADIADGSLPTCHATSGTWVDTTRPVNNANDWKWVCSAT
jgi:hypothetical protein